MTERSLVSPGPSQDGPFLWRAAGRAALAALAGMSLAFAPPAPTPTPSSTKLENTHWALVASGGEAAGATDAFLLLRPNQARRQLGGFGGCNGLKGTYDLFAGRLRIDASALAGKPCPAAAAARETKLVEALKATANYRIEGDLLKLLSADGRVLATFRKSPAS
jgi:heat shock protein HslJ